MPRQPDEVLADQRTRNRRSADAWERYRPHREKVTTLLTPPGRPSTLLVVGAGNGNDVDLEALGASLDRVLLVDLDAEAVARAIERLPETTRERVRPVCPVDVSGIATELASWSVDPQSLETLVRALSIAPETVRASMGEITADVVLSACVLTQLIEACRRAITDAQTLGAVVARLWRSHLRVLAGLASPGGRVVLVTDMVSSDTCPDLASTPEQSLDARMISLVTTQNFFTGTNPFLMEKCLREEPELSRLARDVVRHRPWIWQQGEDRAYLTHALSFTRTAS